MIRILLRFWGKITSFVNNFKPEQFELVITVCTFNFHQTFETTSKTYNFKSCLFIDRTLFTIQVVVLLWQRLCSVIHTGSACARKPSSPPRECTLVSSCTVERKVGETVHTTSCILSQASLEFTYGMMIYNFFTLTWDSLMWSK